MLVVGSFKVTLMCQMEYQAQARSTNSSTTAAKWINIVTSLKMNWQDRSLLFDAPHPLLIWPYFLTSPAQVPKDDNKHHHWKMSWRKCVLLWRKKTTNPGYGWSPFHTSLIALDEVCLFYLLWYNMTATTWPILTEPHHSFQRAISSHFSGQLFFFRLCSCSHLTAVLLC